MMCLAKALTDHDGLAMCPGLGREGLHIRIGARHLPDNRTLVSTNAPERGSEMTLAIPEETKPVGLDLEGRPNIHSRLSMLDELVVTNLRMNKRHDRHPVGVEAPKPRVVVPKEEHLGRHLHSIMKPRVIDEARNVEEAELRLNLERDGVVSPLFANGRLHLLLDARNGSLFHLPQLAHGPTYAAG